MHGEYRLLVIDEPVEFEKQPVKFQDSGKLPISLKTSVQHTSNEPRKTETSQHLTGWAWTH
jgi:hypothetical protein